MNAHDYRLDLTEQKVIQTSTVDSSITIPAQPNAAVNPAAAKLGSWWLITVTGAVAFLNIGSAASAAANVALPVGFSGVYWLPPNQAIHAITASGSGQVSFTRVLLSYQ